MIDITFDVFNKTTHLAHVRVNDNIVTAIAYTDDRIFTPFHLKNVTAEMVMRFLRNRCFESTRPDKDDILRILGLKQYSVLDIVRVTHGVMAEDYIWLRFDGEDVNHVCYEKLFDR